MGSPGCSRGGFSASGCASTSPVPVPVPVSVPAPNAPNPPLPTLVLGPLALALSEFVVGPVAPVVVRLVVAAVLVARPLVPPTTAALVNPPIPRDVAELELLETASLVPLPPGPESPALLGGSELHAPKPRQSSAISLQFCIVSGYRHAEATA